MAGRVGTRIERVALTGGIGTGKSYVRAQLERAGVPTIDADVLAREAVAPGSPGLEAVVRRFGDEVVTPEGDLDRRALGRIVFADAEARRDLEALIHPAVRRATDAWFASLDPRRHPFAVADVPLLYEAGREKDFDRVIVTACHAGVQAQRIVARDRLTDEEARQRIASQLPQEEKIRRADYVIRTDGTFAETNQQIRKVLESLRGGTL